MVSGSMVSASVTDELSCGTAKWMRKSHISFSTGGTSIPRIASSAFERWRKVPLGVFMENMKGVHHEIWCRVKQLERGAHQMQDGRNTSGMMWAWKWPSNPYSSGCDSGSRRALRNAPLAPGVVLPWRNMRLLQLLVRASSSALGPSSALDWISAILACIFSWHSVLMPFSIPLFFLSFYHFGIQLKYILVQVYWFKLICHVLHDHWSNETALDKRNWSTANLIRWHDSLEANMHGF